VWRNKSVPFLARFFSKRTLLADRFLYATPASLGLEAEEVVFRSTGGVHLRGWFFEGKKRGTVVFCSGNAANVSFHLEYARLAARTGYSLLCFDYRGFGRSDGEPDLCFIVRDVEAACAFARTRSSDPVALFGISLGANAALAAAGGGAGEISGVAAEGVSDLPAMLEGLFARGVFGPVRVEWTAGEDTALRPRVRTQLVRGGLPPILARIVSRAAAAFYPFEARSLRALAPGLTGKPVLLIHGVEDQLLPFEAALDLQQELKDSSRLWLIPSAGHAQEPVLTHGEAYTAQLGAFLDQAFSGTMPAERVIEAREVPGERTVDGKTFFRYRLEIPAGSGKSESPGLVSALGGGALRQFSIRGAKPAEIELPGRLESVTVLALHGGDEDERSRLYIEGGYHRLFRRLVRYANECNLSELDSALGEYMKLERGYPFDFLASAYCLRAAQAGLGLARGWGARDDTVARRSLERFGELTASMQQVPGEDVAGSPAAWAKTAMVERGWRS
jgi:pimeloyl-ACP methyl ester carboxylesterase